MELIITGDNIQSKENFTLEDLPLASNYAKEAIVNQRKRINEIILDGMEECIPAIELPFALFPKIEEEMQERGWIKSGYQCYQPIWAINHLEQHEIRDEADKIISAKAFYDSTLKYQLIALKDKFEEAREQGVAKIVLKIQLYKVIADKLKLQGWEVCVCNGMDRIFTGPSTTIRIK